MSNCPKKEITITGKSVDEALKTALAELGVAESEVTYTVDQEPSKGILGLGAKDAIITVTVNDECEEAPKSAPVTENNSSADTSASAEKFLADLFSAMGIEVEIEAEKVDGNLNINLSGDDMGIIIGKRGDTLDSIQYLTSLVANKNRDNEAYTRVTIDTEGYREKRVEALKALSNRLADKVTRSCKKYTLEPMNPYERRIIHANLQDSETVTTFSIGEEPYRKVVIAPKNERRRPSYSKKPRYEKKPEYVSDPSMDDEDLPMTYPGGGSAVHKPKVSSFEEYLAEHEND